MIDFTWMFECLSLHPAIHFPGGKEIHFWDQQRERGIDWWLGRFPQEPNDLRKKGEITPAYALLDDGEIRQIAAVAPELRLFYSIRDPIARAWSAALMALKRAEMEFEEASDLWFIDHFKSAGSRRRGDYLSSIDRWSAVFGAERLHLVVFDDIVANPQRVLEGIARHLGVDPEFFANIPAEQVSRTVPSIGEGHLAGPSHALRPLLLQFLRAMYKPTIEGLGKRLTRDFSHWLR